MTTETKAKLDADRVEAIFIDCLFVAGEDTSKHVNAEGVACDVDFHPERLNSHKEEIASMLDELSDDFKQNGGGGMSFLNGCVDKHGRQWTGLHQRVAQLFQLGIAIGKAKWLYEKPYWAVLPGGMPYYVVS